ncbi:hypothetical protein BS78_07G135000 [Paspalum vaginatum]|nr:hypothetical protein BS78_07G135000 [Paspalum vaginatum]
MQSWSPPIQVEILGKDELRPLMYPSVKCSQADAWLALESLSSTALRIYWYLVIYNEVCLLIGTYDQLLMLVGTEVQHFVSEHCFLKEVMVECYTMLDDNIWKGSSVAGMPLLKLLVLRQQKNAVIPSFIRVVVFLWQSTQVIPLTDCAYWCSWNIARCLPIDNELADFPNEYKKPLLKQDREATLLVFVFQQYKNYLKIPDSVWSDGWLTSCTKNIQVPWDPGSWSYIQLVDKSKYMCKLLPVVEQQMFTCKKHYNVQERLAQVQLKREKSNQSMKQCETMELHLVIGSCTWTCYLLDSEDVLFKNVGMHNLKFIYLKRCTRGKVTAIQVLNQGIGVTFRLLVNYSS